MATPSARATTGFTYVITVARLGPTSAISLKKNRNASAEQISPSTTIDASASADGVESGRSASAKGITSSVAIASDAATGPSGSTSERRRFTIIGPTA